VGYEHAAVETATSLSFLNFGQSAIFSVGLTAMMMMSAQVFFFLCQTSPVTGIDVGQKSRITDT